MKPEPPSASARLYASTAVAIGHDLEPAFVDPAAPAGEDDDAGPDRTRDRAADDPVADLLERRA